MLVFKDFNNEELSIKVILHYTEEGIRLPGCWSEGDTEKEALENIQDAICQS